MPDGKRPIFLDTCTIIYLAEGLAMRPDALATIENARATGDVLVSPISPWETARRIGATFITRDAAILRYGADGHVSVMAC